MSKNEFEKYTNTYPLNKLTFEIKKNKNLLKWIEQNTPNDCQSLRERIQILLGDEYICRYGKRKKFRDSRFVACGRSNVCLCRYEHENRKRRETNLKRYGVEIPFQSEEIKTKIKQTNLEKYGVDNPAKSDSIKYKTKKSNIIKYKTDHPLKSDNKNQILSKIDYEITNQKRKETNQKKYGVDYFFHKDAVRKKATQNKTNKIIVNEQLFLNLYNENNDIYETAKEFNLSVTRIYQLIQKFNLKYKKPLLSKGQNEILIWLNKYVECINQDRNQINPQELDIWLPEYNIAIEFNGIYWHSTKFKPKEFYLDKTKACENKGIQLIHIFEDEWFFKQEIVKSRILHLLNKTANKVYARQCKIKNVSSKETIQFLNENHIQGSTKSNINFGLYYDDTLVSIMTFGKSRFNKKYDYELLRFCNKNYVHVIGGASKLFKYFLKNYSGSIISYADRRWSIGNLYKQLGFVFEYNSSPNYFYVKGPLRESRIKYQKHKLSKLLNTFDSNLTEEQNMINNGYAQIYDCGNQVWIYN